MKHTFTPLTALLLASVVVLYAEDSAQLPATARHPAHPNLVLNTLGEDNWEFYRSALSTNTTIQTQRNP